MSGVAGMGNGEMVTIVSHSKVVTIFCCALAARPVSSSYRLRRAPAREGRQPPAHLEKSTVVRDGTARVRLARALPRAARHEGRAVAGEAADVRGDEVHEAVGDRDEARVGVHDALVQQLRSA